MLLTDIYEVKSYIQMPPEDCSEDILLGFLIEVASEWILEWLDRRNLEYKQRTEYYDGKGTTKLLLRARPVFSDPNRPITVVVDSQGGYGQIPNSFQGQALTYGNDYYLQIDQDDGISSRSGILIRQNQFWHKRRVRYEGLLVPQLMVAPGTIQVTYFGGFTVDSMPAAFRFSCNFLVSRMRFVLPIGFQLSADSYGEKTISILQENKNYLMGLVIPNLVTYRNWTFGV